MKHILMLALILCLINIQLAYAHNLALLNNHNTLVNESPGVPHSHSVLSPADGEGLFKAGVITVSVGAATLLVGSVIRWSFKDTNIKSTARYIQFAGICLMGIPIGVAITTPNGRINARSTRRSRGWKRWRR